MGLKIICCPKGTYMENTYLITDEATGSMAVIDPGYFGSEITNEIKDGADLKYLLLTHAHDDHFRDVQLYMDKYKDAIFAAPAGDLELLRKYGCPEPQKTLKEGDIITLGETELRVIETPGHTGGGICFVTDKEVFSGDTLFRMSVGRTDLETGDWDALVDSIKNKLFELDGELKVYSGHGMETDIAFEKRANPFV